MKTLKARCDRMIAVGLATLFSMATFAADIHAPWARYAAASTETIETDDHDKGKSSVLIDLSGNGHDAVIGGWAFKKTDSVRGPSLWASGWFSSYIYRATPTALSRTFAAWVKRDTKNSANDSYADLTGDEPLCLLRNFGGLDIRTGYKTSHWQVYANDVKVDGLSVVYTRLRWQHVAVTVSDSGARDASGNVLSTVALYADGACVASADGVPLPADPSGAMDLVGWCAGNPQHYSFVSFLDDARLYDQALTAAEIAALYKDTRRTKLMARFRMDEILEDEGVYTTPNAVDPARPMTLGSAVYVTNGVEGVKALFFPGPSTQQTAEFPSYGIYQNGTEECREDVILSFWVNRSRDQYEPGTRFLNLLSGTSTIPIFNYNSSDLVGDGKIATLSNLGTPRTGVLRRNEEWAHVIFAFSYEFTDTTDGSELPFRSMRMRTYLNGVLTSDPADKREANVPCVLSRTGAKFVFANNQDDWKSPARMAVDDVRIHFGVVDDAVVQDIYRSASCVNAGVDFTVKGEAAVLSGTVGDRSPLRLCAGAAGKSRWSLVSAPAGGEGAVIETPAALSTRVTLPVAGTYVFRLSNVAADEAEEDTVSVTREDGMTPVGTSATVSAQSVNGLCAVVQADVAAGARVRWLQKSGPGGAFFANPAEQNTLVTFSASGDYVLTCEVSDGAQVACYDLAVAATGTTLANQLADCLTAHWSFNSLLLKDSVNQYDLSLHAVTYATGGNFVPGAFGSYGLQNGRNIISNGGSCFKSTGFKYHRDQYDDLPRDEWIAVSLWMYHNGMDAMPCYSAALANLYVCQGLFYLPRWGASADFEVRGYCQGSPKFWGGLYFKGPSHNLTNRWTHVVALINQRGTRPDEPVEIWVDGQKLERKSQPDGMPAFTTARLQSDGQWDFGGSRNDLALSYAFEGGPTTAADLHGHRFPGSLDEIRIYHRYLSAAEIRCLYENPLGANAEKAPVTVVPLATVRMQAKESASLTAQAFAAAGGKTLTYRWTVLSGDASKVVFSDALSLTPSVTFKRGGEYRLQLAASDGARTTYSEPVVVDVSPTGLILLFK